LILAPQIIRTLNTSWLPPSGNVPIINFVNGLLTFFKRFNADKEEIKRRFKENKKCIEGR